MAKENNVNEEILERMITPVTFNTVGAPPNRASWDFTPQQIRKYVKEQSRKWLDDATDVSLEPNGKGDVLTVVWLPNNSKHFKNSVTENTVINMSLKEYSSDLKDFVSKFGVRGDGKNANKPPEAIVPSVSDARNFTGIRINLERFLRVMLDADNIEYNKTFNENKRPNCRLQATWHFKEYKDRKYDTIEYLEVSKIEKNPFRDNAPRATRAGKF